MELRINSFFQNTGHLTQPERRNVQWKRFHSSNVKEYLLRTLNTLLQGKVGEEALSRALYDSFYSSKVKDKLEKQATDTYSLVDAKIFMEATK